MANKQEQWIEEFDREYVATGADIEGMKRVEYRQLREHQVDQIKSFIKTHFISRSELKERIETKRKDWMKKNRNLPGYNMGGYDALSEILKILES